jgi:murein DD-endopeptidase MepM/ murein hydrolase activator NlpD
MSALTWFGRLLRAPFKPPLVAALVGLGPLVLQAVVAAAPGDDGSGEPWSWPLTPRPAVVSLFDPPDLPYGAGNRGVELAGSVGQTVLAIGTGVVTYAGVLAGRGVVVVSHGRLRSTYEPVSAAIGVGDRVAAGQPIGVLASVGSHCPPQACLHLGVLRGSVYIDPLALLGAPPIRLKPLGGDSTTISDRRSSIVGAVDAAVAAANYPWPTVR